MGDSAQTNGAAKPRQGSPDLLQAPSNLARAQARIQQGRAATLAALEGGEETAPDSTSAPSAAAPSESSASEATPHDNAADGAGSEPKPATPAPKPAQGDDHDKRLASIQQAEKRARDTITKEREALASARAELERERAELEAFKRAKERAALDPLSVLEQLGVDDFEYVSKQAFGRTQGKTDPNQREAAARLMQLREHGGELAQLKAQYAELVSKLDARDQQATFDSHRRSYLDEAVKTIGDDAPITKALAAKNPDKLREKLWEATIRIADETGDIPDYGDVIAAYERSRREELDELGATLSTTTNPPKQNTTAAVKQNAARTLGNDLSTPRVPRPRTSEKEHRAETLAMLEAGRTE